MNMNIKNITATCCGDRLSAPGRAIECPKCRTMYQVREDDGKIVLTTARAPSRAPNAWWHKLIRRLPIIGRRFRPTALRAHVYLELP